MKVTIKDIAKIAGVSPSTVSRAISGNKKISEETREKILNLIEEKDYHPNVVAQSLVNREAKTIGVVFPGGTSTAFQHSFYREVFAGIVSLSHEKGYKILLSTIMQDSKSHKKIINDLAQGGGSDGIILMSSGLNDPIINELIKLNFPFVVIGKPRNDAFVNWVDNDNTKISYKLVEYLIKIGHKKIAFIGVSKDNVVTLERFRGYKLALSNYNIHFDPDLVREDSGEPSRGYLMTQELLKKKIAFTALVGADDYIALSAIKCLSENGLKIPDDAAVAGFNNVPASEYFMPSLTTVEVNPYKLGIKAAEMIITNLKSTIQSYNRALIPASLVIRESTQRIREGICETQKDA